MSELDAAWNAVHDALPAGWQVMRPSYYVETRQWHVFAADDRDGRKQPDYIEAVGQDDAHCPRGLAELLRVSHSRRGQRNGPATERATLTRFARARNLRQPPITAVEGGTLMRRVVAALLAVSALAASAPAVLAQESEDASCTAHFVHGPAGPPGIFRSQFGGDIDAGFVHPFGEIVSDVAQTEGATFEECVANLQPR